MTHNIKDIAIMVVTTSIPTLVSVDVRLVLGNPKKVVRQLVSSLEPGVLGERVAY